MYKLAVMGCQHLGYAQKGMNRTIDGVNMREVDGYIAHNQIIDAALAEGVDGIFDGGDLSHVEHPSNRTINEAIKADNKRVEALGSAGEPVWRITNGGNHDNGASAHLSAVSHIHRSHLGSRAVFPEDDKPTAEQIGPYPGFYEVHQPDPNLDLYLHVVSHNGLDPKLAERGIIIDPQPIDGAVNLLFSHGIFSADGRLFGAEDRHGALRVIPEEWANRGFDQLLLSDYHTPGPIPGFGEDGGRQRGQVWMTGSAVRRGFSDEESPRGWLLVTLHDDGRITVELRTIWQRPQVEFPPIDARTMSAENIDELVRERLAKQDMWDEESAQLTGDGGYILRQRITHTTPHQRRVLASSRREWAAAAHDAAYWSADYTKPLSVTVDERHQDNDEEDNTDEGGFASHIAKAPQSRNLEKAFQKRRETGQVGATLRTLAMNDRKIHDEVVSRVAETLTGINSTT